MIPATYFYAWGIVFMWVTFMHNSDIVCDPTQYSFTNVKDQAKISEEGHGDFDNDPRNLFLEWQ